MPQLIEHLEIPLFVFHLRHISSAAYDQARKQDFRWGVRRRRRTLSRFKRSQRAKILRAPSLNLRGTRVLLQSAIDFFNMTTLSENVAPEGNETGGA